MHCQNALLLLRNELFAAGMLPIQILARLIDIIFNINFETRLIDGTLAVRP